MRLFEVLKYIEQTLLSVDEQQEPFQNICIESAYADLQNLIAEHGQPTEDVIEQNIGFFIATQKRRGFSDKHFDYPIIRAIKLQENERS